MMKNIPVSEELKAVLMQWDDTDESARAASEARLQALGPDVLPELTALTYLLERRGKLGTSICISSVGIPYAVLMGTLFLLPHERHAPTPPWLLWLMAVCLLTMLGGLGLGVTLLSARLSVNLMHALVTLPPTQSLPLLLRLRYNDKTDRANSSVRLTTVRKHCLTTVLNHITEADTLSLAPEEMRILRGLVNMWQYADLAAAALKVLILLNDASLLPQVRRIVRRTRHWELQEAANDYLRHFAPEEVTIRSGVQPDLVEDAETVAVNSASILACVMRLGSRDLAERQAAENRLRAMQPEELSQILPLLDQETPADKRVSYATLAASSVLCALPGGLIYFWAVHWPYFDAHMAAIVAVACAWGCGAVGFLKGSSINYNRRNRLRARLLGNPGGVFPEKRLLESLSCLENPALLGTILEQMPSSNTVTKGYLRRALRQSLQNLLPRLQASDSGLLSVQHRELLNRELQGSHLKLAESWAGDKQATEQADLDIAILKAWEQVGDERALGGVQQLANMTTKSPTKKRVKSAAQECLPYLEARVGEQRRTQMLLRASEVPAEAGNVLLRAAQANQNATEPQQLLRSSHHEA